MKGETEVLGVVWSYDTTHSGEMVVAIVCMTVLMFVGFYVYDHWAPK